jgi:hypothetical protein
MINTSFVWLWVFEKRAPPVVAFAAGSRAGPVAGGPVGAVLRDGRKNCLEMKNARISGVDAQFIGYYSYNVKRDFRII